MRHQAPDYEFAAKALLGVCILWSCVYWASFFYDLYIFRDISRLPTGNAKIWVASLFLLYGIGVFLSRKSMAKKFESNSLLSGKTNFYVASFVVLLVGLAVSYVLHVFF
jgi:hypothetical protein